MEFLRVDGIKCGYGDVVICDHISFEVRKGEFIGIIGPNGAGKTTLLKTLSHIIKPSSGTVFLEGRNIHSMDSNSFAKACAMVGQDLLSIFSFTVEEIVIMGRNPYLGLLAQERREDLDVVNRALDSTSLTDLRCRLINELSAGERQRVLVARALAQDPGLLLLDEPTAHLDIGYQVEILDLIRSINKEKELTVISVLHDLNLASQYCDKLLLLDHGDVEGFGTPDEILKYEIIEKIFNATVMVNEKALNGRPMVVPISKKIY